MQHRQHGVRHGAGPDDPDGAATRVIDDRLLVGAAVEVHTRFNDSWNPGFEIAEVFLDAYRIRRTADRTLLPDPTGATDVRPARPPPAWR